jgi:hypothetical protein
VNRQKSSLPAGRTGTSHQMKLDFKLASCHSEQNKLSAHTKVSFQREVSTNFICMREPPNQSTNVNFVLLVNFTLDGNFTFPKHNKSLQCSSFKISKSNVQVLKSANPTCILHSLDTTGNTFFRDSMENN